MQVKLLLLFLLSFSIFECAFSQADTQYTSNELSAFVEIYFAQKADKKVNHDMNVRRYTVTERQSFSSYDDWFKKSLIGEEIEFVQQLIILLAIGGVERYQLELDIEIEKELNSKCETSNIKVETYYDILNKYQGNLDFQKVIKPYFLAYFNRIHK